LVCADKIAATIVEFLTMVYIAGLAGFIAGFFLGQVILLWLLRSRSNKEILSSQKIRWTYGILNWIVAAAGSYAAVTLYRIYFGY
jgi:hypothetical protein